MTRPSDWWLEQLADPHLAGSLSQKYPDAIEARSGEILTGDQRMWYNGDMNTAPATDASVANVVVHIIDPTEGESASEPMTQWNAGLHQLDLVAEAKDRGIPAVMNFQPEHPLPEFLYTWTEKI